MECAFLEELGTCSVLPFKGPEHEHLVRCIPQLTLAWLDESACSVIRHHLGLSVGQWSLYRTAFSLCFILLLSSSNLAKILKSSAFTEEHQKQVSDNVQRVIVLLTPKCRQHFIELMR